MPFGNILQLQRNSSFVSSQNILAILLFAKAFFAVTSALFSYPRPSSNKAFIAFVYG
jgi:hypothetical protein